MRKKNPFLALFALPLFFLPVACKKEEKSAILPADLPTEREEEQIEGNETNETTLETIVKTEPTETVFDSPTVATYGTLTADVNLRSGAGTNYAVLTSLKKGTSYALKKKVGNWYEIAHRGKVGYVSAGYVSTFTLPKSDKKAVEAVLEEGYKLLGTPYVFGAVRYHDGAGNRLSGFTTQKFDCSSLTQYIFYTGAKKLLGTTTRAQVVQGTFVPKSSLSRGDCIYFTNASRKNNVGVERVGHVAVYLGNDYILHTSSDYARIEKMNATRWGYYIESRRFL